LALAVHGPLLRGCMSAAAAWFVLEAPTASASRVGPPWQARITVDRAVLYTAPDPGSAPVGQVSRCTVVVVTGETDGVDDKPRTATTLGYLPSSNLTESIEPWVADVVAECAPVYAKPNARDAVRLNAKRGDPLRVVGVSPGINGDSNLWWSTREGYVALDARAPSQNPWSTLWTVPDAVAGAEWLVGRRGVECECPSAPQRRGAVGRAAGCGAVDQGPGQESGRGRRGQLDLVVHRRWTLLGVAGCTAR
jgi:hypothetical protein